jgi:hypothetical protein
VRWLLGYWGVSGCVQFSVFIFVAHESTEKNSSLMKRCRIKSASLWKANSKKMPSKKGLC